MPPFFSLPKKNTRKKVTVKSKFTEAQTNLSYAAVALAEVVHTERTAGLEVAATLNKWPLPESWDLFKAVVTWWNWWRREGSVARGPAHQRERLSVVNAPFSTVTTGLSFQQAQRAPPSAHYRGRNRTFLRWHQGEELLLLLEQSVASSNAPASPNLPLI